MLQHELYVFIRGLPGFSGMLFEELERVRPFVEVLHFKEGDELKVEEGCSIVYRGQLEAFNGDIIGRGGALYHPPGRSSGWALTPLKLVHFPEAASQILLRKEPELALPLLERMKGIESKMMGQDS